MKCSLTLSAGQKAWTVGIGLVVFLFGDTAGTFLGLVLVFLGALARAETP